MKRATLLLFAIVLSIAAGYAQNLVITEVDAPSMIAFNKPAFQLLTQKMNLAIIGDKMRVKIGQYTYMLIKTSDQDFKVENLTKEGTQIYSIKLNRTNSVITSAEFTSVLVHKDLGKKDIWSLNAMRNPNVVSPAQAAIKRGSGEMAAPMMAVHFTSDSGAAAPELAASKKNHLKLIAAMTVPNSKNDLRSVATARMITTRKDPKPVTATSVATTNDKDKGQPQINTSTSVAVTKVDPTAPVVIIKYDPTSTKPVGEKTDARTVSPIVEASNDKFRRNSDQKGIPPGGPVPTSSTVVISSAAVARPASSNQIKQNRKSKKRIMKTNSKINTPNISHN